MKKPYIRVKDRKQRKDIVDFARNNSWAEAMAKYNVSIATLKRWSSAYNQEKSPARTSTRERRLKYQKVWSYLIMEKHRLLLDLRYQPKYKKFLRKKAAKRLPSVHRSTIWRLVQDVTKTRNQRFGTYF